MAEIEFQDEFGQRFVASLGLEQKADLAEEQKLAGIRKQGRAAAVELGRQYGEADAGSRGEVGVEKDHRVRRAMAYAAWEFDGKPLGGGHASEFGLPARDLLGALRGGRDQKPGGKK